MKQFFSLLLLSFSLSICAQDYIKKDSTAKAHPAYFGINFVPEFCSRLMTNVDGSQSTDETIDAFNELYGPKFGFTTGLNFLFDLNQRFSIETGLHYSNQGFCLKKFDLTSPIATSPIAVRGVLTAHYTQVPLKLQFNINNNNTRYFLNAGLVSSFLIQTNYTSIYYYQDDTKSRVTQETTGDIKKFSLSPTLGFGADFYLNEKSRFRIEPTIKFGVIPFLFGPSINTHLWSGGINFCYYIVT